MPASSLLTGIIIEGGDIVSSDVSAVGRSSNEIMRNYLCNATTKATLTPKIFKETLRSLLASFGSIFYLNGENQLTPIKAIHSIQERAVAKLYQENNIILPIITIGHTGTDSDLARRRYNPILIQSQVWNDATQRAERVISYSDVPIKLGYTLNLWTKYIEDLDQITQSIRFKFNPALEILTPFSSQTKAFLESETDNSEVVVADRTDRLIKKSFTLSIETYIPSPKFKVTSTGEIEQFNGEAWFIP